MRRPARIALLALLLVSACDATEPTVIDGTSPESFERTTREARRDIPDADRLVFDRALRTIGGRRHAVRDAEALARVSFDGRTAGEVVAAQHARVWKRGMA